MLRLRVLSDFRLANGNGHEQPFDDLLTNFNFILLTRAAGTSHNPASDLIRSLTVECEGVEEVPVRRFDIRSLDGFCDRCCGPHVVSEEGGDLVTICDSGGLIRRLWGVEADTWILVVNRSRNVLDDGPLAEIERLVTQFNLDVALSPHRIARAPPDRKDTTAG